MQRRARDLRPCLLYTSLLDDVMSELDAGRQHYLLNRLDGRQVFLTCCEPGAVKRLEEGALFEVRRGELYVPTSGAGHGD